MSQDAILIAAQSGRALAQAARRAGLRPFVLDLFGDEDTRALSEAYATLPGRFGTGRLGAAMLSGFEAFAGRIGGRPLGVALGSGFEAVPATIAAIAARYRLLGAGADTVAALKNPQTFAALCSRLSIPHPSITTDPVPDRSAWLIKRAGGSGGSHIRAAGSGRAPPGHYFQERVSGRACGLNLIADGRDCAVLALTEQWCAASPLRPYRYAGAVAPGSKEKSPVSPAVLKAVTEAVARLVSATRLRGLASADLLVDGERWWLLEINPRPGATLDVLDRRARPLLDLHIEASLGCLPAIGSAPADAAGSEICYAPRRYAAVPPVAWPDYVRDRPTAGSSIGRDAPFCTVTAVGTDAGSVKDTLRERRAALSAELAGGEEFHGHRHQATEHQRVDGPARREARE